MVQVTLLYVRIKYEKFVDKLCKSLLLYFKRYLIIEILKKQSFENWIFKIWHSEQRTKKGPWKTNLFL